MICFAEAIEDHAADPNSTVDGIDSTFNTNRYNYKLTLITTVRRDGKTRIKAIALMLFEDKESFVTMFKWYRDAFGSLSSATISDGDMAMRAAIVEVFGQDYADKKHILCVWHESKVVVKHIKPLFGAQVSGKRGAGGNDAKWNGFIRTRVARARARAPLRPVVCAVRALCAHDGIPERRAPRTQVAGGSWPKSRTCRRSTASRPSTSASARSLRRCAPTPTATPSRRGSPGSASRAPTTTTTRPSGASGASFSRATRTRSSPGARTRRSATRA